MFLELELWHGLKTLFPENECLKKVVMWSKK